MGGGHEHEDDPDSDRAANEHEHACGLADRTAAGTPSRVVPPIVHSGGDSVIPVVFRSVRLFGECVAKLFAALRTSNNRIRLKRGFESMLRHRACPSINITHLERENSFATHSRVERKCPRVRENGRMTSARLETPFPASRPKSPCR